MSIGLIVAIALAALLVLSVPIAFALGISALLGILLISPDFLILIPQRFMAGVDGFTLLAIPLFILAGSIMGRGGIAARIVEMAMVFVGRVRGGLGMVVVLSTMFFSGISGSASADTAAIGSVTYPAMRAQRYPPPFAAALIAAAGGTAALVPPSIDLVMIGVVANISIGGLFAAGFLPGAVNAIGVLVVTYWLARKLDLPLEPHLGWPERLRRLRNGIPALLMAVIILGGIFGGVFTPTEASAVAVVYGFVVTFFFYRELRLEDIPKVLLDACQLTGMVLLVVGMASVFSYVLTFERVPHQLSQWILEVAGNWILFVLLVSVVFFLLGMVMDALPALIVLMPILVPIGVSLGMDPIHIGILVAANVGVSLVSPPVGLCLFVACGLSKQPLEPVIRAMLPFYVALIATTLVISYVPEITLLVPRLLGYVGK